MNLLCLKRTPTPQQGTLSCLTRSRLLNISGITSDQMDMKTPKRVYICLPKKHMAALAQTYQLDHGVIVKDLNTYINEGYVLSYFREWGTITACKVKKNPNLGENNSIAYVRFSTEDEADRAEWAGPHYIGGDVEVKRVVSPKMDKDSEEEAALAVAPSRPRRSMGLGYILEDAQWLDDKME